VSFAEKNLRLTTFTELRLAENVERTRETMRSVSVVVSDMLGFACLTPPHLLTWGL
jgi:hypothetical protein